MASDKLNRIIRRATPAEKRRHNQIREKTDKEFAPRRKAVSASRVPPLKRCAGYSAMLTWCW